MTTDEVIRFFGSIREASKAIGVSYQAVWAWAYRGRIPLNTQCRIQLLTGGRLQADQAHQATQPTAA